MTEHGDKLGTVIATDGDSGLLLIGSDLAPSDALICLRELYARTQPAGTYLPSHPVVMRDAIASYIDDLEGSAE